ncbi:hypothetical protein GEI7407_0345 [Geitlerinema sp. PCC 7407]|nr:hypothetical protein GEI7407_0345 [Geitlerinema sp. PCC 7407]
MLHAVLKSTKCSSSESKSLPTSKHLKNLIMARGEMNQQVIHPMVKFQRQVRSLVESKIVRPSDSIWKIALLYGDEWSYWKRELEEFEFSMQDPISDLLAVESWEEEE